ncbi:hypothetical protein [Desulfospira joergensenii]|uniref:hypothetical protein n=1 Tax=Desulfospira joergensenii TaxID=53329 RepID=UPI0003B47667|nr:hypothetical protein [Desulfospira joergensenii]
MNFYDSGMINSRRVIRPFPASLAGALFILLAACAMGLGCDTPISEYRPKAPVEKEILPILIEFQEARNHYDIKRLLPLLHDRGQFSFGCGIMVSKAELEKMLPEFWAKMRSEKLAVVPLAHECLNGDYYPSGVLKEPIIKINGNTAKARVWFTKRFSSSLLLFFNLVREDGKWVIIRTEWGPS